MMFSIAYDATTGQYNVEVTNTDTNVEANGLTKIVFYLLFLCYNLIVFRIIRDDVMKNFELLRQLSDNKNEIKDFIEDTNKILLEEQFKC